MNGGRSPVYITAVADGDHKDEQLSAMHLVDNAVVSNTYSPGAVHRGKLFAARRKAIFSKGLNLGGDTPLNVTGEVFKLSLGERLELDGIGHGGSSTHSLSFFLIVSQGTVRGSFRASRAAATSISSSNFSRSLTSSMGTTAATAFFPRCTLT